MEGYAKLRSDDVLKQLETARQKNVYSIYIPSLEKDVMFTEMTTAQEKSIVKCIVDNPVHNAEFIFTIRKIIMDNCVEDIDIDSLTLIDKGMICLGMRAKSIGDEYTISKDGERHIVSITKIMEQYSKIKMEKPVEIKDKEVTVVCVPPIIKDEYELEKMFKSKYSDNLEDKNEIMNEIEILFDSEIVKYVKWILIETEDGGINEIDMQSYGYKERIKFINSLSNKILTGVVKYIEDYKKTVSEALTILAENINTEVEVEISRDFFIIQ